MNDNDKSFETVELFSPIELTPIDGIEGPKTIEGPKPVAELNPVADTKSVAEHTPVAEPKPVTEPAEQKPVAEPEKAGGSSKWDAVLKNSKPELYQQDFDGQYDQSGFDQDSFDQGSFTQGSFDQGGFNQNGQFYNGNRDQASQKAAGIDLSYFYNNTNELKRKRELEAKKIQVFVVAGIFFVAFIVGFIGFRRGAGSKKQDKNINDPLQNIAVEKQVATNDYARQDVIYGTIDYDTTGAQANQFFDISSKVIEYTGPYERTLYFEYTPKEDNKVLRMEVEMVDRYGNSMGTVVAFKKNVPAGEKAIIDIPFGIDQFTELVGVTYNITAEGYTLANPEENKNIPAMEQTDDILYVSIDGGLNVTKDAFVVFYKNGRVCNVMYGSPSYNSNGRATFYLGDIDYDDFEVFY